MPRRPRQLSASGFYHVVVKGIDRLILFESNSDYSKYLDILEKHKIECDFEIYAYCLMSNHIHIILKVNSTPLHTIFQKLNTHYAIWFNMKYQRTGHLLDNRYHSTPIEDLDYLLTAIRYVHHNPRKACLENYPGEKYPWSSIYEFTDCRTRFINVDSIYSFIPKNDFIAYNMVVTNDECLDIDKIRHSIPDDVAKEIILQECHCKTSTDFQNLSIIEQEKYLIVLKKKGISIRQLNRLTGIPRGIIQRAK